MTPTPVRSTTAASLRLCFVGDSFVQGVGDPGYRGWVGRVLEASGPDLTAFNLGIRRDTSDDVLSRWRQETAARFLPGADNRLVVSFGSNDMVEQGDGTLRVEPARSLANLAALLDSCGSRGICVLVVGPPPVADAGESHLLRTAELSDRMAALCDDRSVAFVPTTRALAADPVWTSEALSGDGAHPAAGGYRRLAELVLSGGWAAWLALTPARGQASSTPR
ncbi:GDSL-type esterase/lipase family protein [Streptacidiphilus monticola]|uniref:GDSL-type esterase/lipase family protein n=1 Tax=Streptacidiphilus monticola TaxID=2161674 RepID=A0ABW1GAX2_9ACTN